MNNTHNIGFPSVGEIFSQIGKAKENAAKGIMKQREDEKKQRRLEKSGFISADMSDEDLDALDRRIQAELEIARRGVPVSPKNSSAVCKIINEADRKDNESDLNAYFTGFELSDQLYQWEWLMISADGKVSYYSREASDSDSDAASLEGIKAGVELIKNMNCQRIEICIDKKLLDAAVIAVENSAIENRNITIILIEEKKEDGESCRIFK